MSSSKKPAAPENQQTAEKPVLPEAAMSEKPVLPDQTASEALTS